MGIAALVLGILAVIIGLVPICGLPFGLPIALVGLVLGIVEVALKSKKNEPKGMGIAGIVLNAIAVAIILIWTVVFVAAANEAAEQSNTVLKEIATEMEKASEQAQEHAEKMQKEMHQENLKIKD